MLNQDQLRKIMPRAPAGALAALNRTGEAFQIRDAIEVAAFLATLAHESSQLTRLEENMNYSADALNRTWPTRFPPAKAAAYHRQPVRIANYVYANRFGNGDEASGDGWKHRGAGGIQLTFKLNQLACADYFEIPHEEIGEWLRTIEGACLSAGWFWMTRGIAQYARAGDFDGVCDKVNLGKKTGIIGDSIGWKERLGIYNLALKELS